MIIRYLTKRRKKFFFGARWTQVNNGLTDTWVWSLAVSGANIFAGTDRGVFLSTDNGTSWTRVNNGLKNTRVRCLAVSGTNIFAGTWGGVWRAELGATTPSSCYGCIFSNAIFRCLTKRCKKFFFGRRWTRVNSVFMMDTHVMSLAVSGTNIFAGTNRGGVFLSTNNGTSWTQVNNGLTNTYVNAFAISGTNIFAGTNGGVFLSTNSGTSWTQVNNGLTNTTVWSLAASGRNIFAGTNGGVFLSTNNGTSWTHVNNGVTYTVSSLAVSGTNIFAGTLGAVFLSTDNGASWTQVNNGLTNSYVTALAVSGTNIFAGTYGGVFLSTNNGTSWTQVNNGLTNSYVTALAVSGTNIFAGIYGGGVWKLVLLPAAPTLASPANGSGVLTNPTLTWNATAGALGYRLQVSTDSSFSSTVFDQQGLKDTLQQVSGLANNTTYYWRVSATGTGGTSQWSATWRFTTVVGAPTLSSPANGSTWVSTSPTLIWNPSVGASSYRLQVSKDSSFSSTVFDQQGLKDTMQQVSGLANGTTYYWHVSATGTGGTSSWSATWRFTTVVATPTLASPANGSGVSTNPTLTWNATAGALGYRLQVSTDSSFSSTVFDQQGLKDTVQQVSGLANGTTYYWHVSATGIGGTSPWSVTWRFTTVIGAPTLSSPANGSTGVSTNPTLTWNTSLGASSYRLQVSTDSSFSSTVFDQQGLKDTLQQVGGLANGTTYYWHVSATGTGGTSPWSATWRFTTVVGAPTLSSPANGSTGVLTNPTLTWNASVGASSYRLQVSKDSSFSTTVFDQQGLKDTLQQVSGLANSSTYYWHVSATGTGGTSPWSVTWRFTTFIYPSTIQLYQQFVPPGSSDKSNYRMIGLPGSIDIPVSALLSGNEGTDWEVYTDNGAAQNYQVKYDGSSTFHFSPGRAFWIFAKKPFSISQTAPTVPLNNSDSYPIPLHVGWNLISNPFEKSIPWSEVQALNGVTQPIYSFNGSYSTATSFDPYTGYYFYNDQNLPSLSIPYVFSASTAHKGDSLPQNVSSVQNNLVKLYLSCEHAEPLSVTVGFDPSVSDTVNKLNIFAPPDDFSNVDMQIIDENVDGYWKRLFSDFRNQIGNGQSFDLEVKNLTGKGATLKPMLADGFENYSAYLVDKGMHILYDLKKTGSIVISGAYKYKSYEILIGGKSFIDSVRALYEPKSFQLFQNYPNPFNPVTIIRFEIPKAEHVSLTVYDVMGRRVETLINANLSPGYYEVPFDGSKLASGIYFFRISAGSFVDMKKGVLVK